MGYVSARADGGSRDVIKDALKPLNSKSERKGRGRGDVDDDNGKQGKDAKGKGDDGKGTDDRGKCEVGKGRDGDCEMFFRPQTHAKGEAIDDLNQLCGAFGDEGLIFLKCTRCNHPGFGFTEVCAMGVCGRCHYRQCAC